MLYVSIAKKMWYFTIFVQKSNTFHTRSRNNIRGICKITAIADRTQYRRLIHSDEIPREQGDITCSCSALELYVSGIKYTGTYPTPVIR